MNNVSRHTVNDDFTRLRTEMAKKLDQIAETLKVRIISFEPNPILNLHEIERISKELYDLESTASTYFLNSILSSYTEHSSEISRAIHHLRAKRHGALIVIEKNDPVTPLISGGTSVNARISSQLLESIFNPESQLNSGAVLIKSDMIISADNKLPYTNQIFWERSFDAHEVSAVGLSEQCDALILLVSDKERSTSFCLGGEIYPFSSMN